MKLKIDTTHDDLYQLSQCAFNARDNSKVVKVPLEALKHMVMDHSKLVGRLQGELTGDL